MKTIKVAKVSLVQLEALRSLGYEVIISQKTEKPSIFGEYRYTKAINPPRTPSCVDHGSPQHVCKVKHSDEK